MSFFIYRSFGYNVNNILGVSKRVLAALVISGAYLANRINDRLIGTVSHVYSTYRPLFDHQYSGSYRGLQGNTRLHSQRPILAQLHAAKGLLDNKLSNQVVIMRVVSKGYMVGYRLIKG